VTALVVVTGSARSGRGALAIALAERLGCAFVSVDEIAEELRLGAAETPTEWLRLDVEAETVRRLDAFAGTAVLDVEVTPAAVARLVELLAPWSATMVEVRCSPGDLPGGPALGAARTVVVDTSRPLELGDVVTAVRGETGARRVVRRH
jgi:hypothetical protein